MKFSLTFKSPDLFTNLPNFSCENHEEHNEDCDACIEIYEEKTAELKQFLKTYIKYEEYLSVEFDTEAKTATVLKQK
jgi:hypothetical protein